MKQVTLIFNDSPFRDRGSVIIKFIINKVNKIKSYSNGWLGYAFYFEIEKIKKVISENIEDKVAVKELNSLFNHHINELNEIILNHHNSKNNLIFWKGHVAIGIYKTKIINAYGPKKKVIIMDLKKTINEIQPDFIFHLAAQSLVYKSYKEPLKTWNSNLIGTLNLLEILS